MDSLMKQQSTEEGYLKSKEQLWFVSSCQQYKACADYNCHCHCHLQCLAFSKALENKWRMQFYHFSNDQTGVGNTSSWVLFNKDFLYWLLWKKKEKFACHIVLFFIFWSMQKTVECVVMLGGTVQHNKKKNTNLLDKKKMQCLQTS